MIIKKQNTTTSGDCTAGYAVTLTKEYTVKEFIDEILSNANEWGYIGIMKAHSIFGSPNCKYKRDKLLSLLPENIMDKIIIEAKASGGWSRMDYLLKL